jgi:acyl-CoA thioester hydrolase
MSVIRPTRAASPHFVTYASRWRDNDVYAHMNNAVFYEYVDSVVNAWLIGTGALRIPGGPVICLVAETGCRYFASLGFPAPVEAGLALERAGTTSIAYRVGLFAPDADEAAALARFVHVCVDAETRRPTPVPEALRSALETLRPGEPVAGAERAERC